jgi:hypothetical protein
MYLYIGQSATYLYFGTKVQPICTFGTNMYKYKYQTLAKALWPTCNRRSENYIYIYYIYIYVYIYILYMYLYFILFLLGIYIFVFVYYIFFS